MDATVFVPAREELARSLRGASPGDIVLLAQEWLRAGNARAAVTVCEVARDFGYDDSAVVLSEAMARFAAGERDRGLGLTDDVLARSPAHLVALSLKARMLIAVGRSDESLELLVRVIDDCPDFPGAHALLSRSLFPGAPYREVLTRIHRILRPDTYLEIGVETGATLLLATTASTAIGVDPSDRPLEHPLPRGARVYRMESDAFFAQETASGVFGGRTVELAFIDGMHWFEYALRDFANAERWASPNGTIVLHDCLPVTAVAARRERVSTFWVGDVWKVLDALLHFRKDLNIHVVPTPPSGLVIVRRLDPRSELLATRMDEIVARYRDLEYDGAPRDWAARYPLVENSEVALARVLSS